MYSEWVKSYRDPPILINQWVNVVALGAAHADLLRDNRFLWQEGHTADATRERSRGRETRRTLRRLRRTSPSTRPRYLFIQGKKSEREKFAGAIVS